VGFYSQKAEITKEKTLKASFFLIEQINRTVCSINLNNNKDFLILP
jgi:hypothetical protein